MISVALNDYEIVRGTCTISIAFLAIAFLIIIGISNAFIYFHCCLKKIILILMLMLMPVLLVILRLKQ